MTDEKVPNEAYCDKAKRALEDLFEIGPSFHGPQAPPVCAAHSPEWA
jgi:hypothetical protein